ncbi:MAG: TRAP transporter small permease [Burkholderiales bacterium]|nr:TRAP transporter small permease [Burkholderiales bacterium]
MHGVMRVIRAIERWTLTALLIGMSLGYAGQIVIRAVAPEVATRTSWIEELTVFAMVWLAFLGLGLTLERGRHVAMESLVRKLPPAARKWASRAVDLVGFAFAAYLAKLGWDITVFVRDSGQISPVLDVSMAWLYAVLPAGFGLLALRYLLELAGFSDRSRLRPQSQLEGQP